MDQRSCLFHGRCCPWQQAGSSYFLPAIYMAAFGFLVHCGGQWSFHLLARILLGARRATSPVAELSAPIMMLRLLRASQIVLPLHWFTDSTYAEGLVKGTQRPTTELVLVSRMRKEVRHYMSQAALQATQYPGLIGCPPY